MRAWGLADSLNANEAGDVRLKQLGYSHVCIRMYVEW